MRPSRFLSLRLLPRLLIPYACVTVLLVARLNRFICSQGLGSCECVARDCGFSIQEVRPCWDFQLSASCGVACTRMFWPRLLYRMLSLETALLSSCAGLLPVSSVRHRCASEPLQPVRQQMVSGGLCATGLASSASSSPYAMYSVGFSGALC